MLPHPGGFAAHAELAHALEVFSSLEDDDSLRPHMKKLLDTVADRAAEGDRGRRPQLPDRALFLNKLDAGHRLRPSRAQAFEAMDELVTNGWPRLSSTESTRKRRKRLGTWTGRGRQAATPTQHRLQQVENAVVPTQREALPLAAIAELVQHETNHNPADYEWFQPLGPEHLFAGQQLAVMLYHESGK